MKCLIYQQHSHIVLLQVLKSGRDSRTYVVVDRMIDIRNGHIRGVCVLVDRDPKIGINYS
jgi:hypothetical protein